MNEHLEKLYAEAWKKYHLAIDEYIKIHVQPQPALPLLLGIKNPSEYEKSDFRIMIFGQETNGWGKYAPSINIRELQRWNIAKTEINRSRGQFTNSRIKLGKYFNKYFPDKKSYFLWNNVVKIGKELSPGFPGSVLHNIEKQHFNVLKTELEITKPNILIFFSGYNYDKIIMDKLGPIEQIPIPNFNPNQLCEFRIPNITCAIRTYHPNYLFRNDINKYFHAIVQRIKMNTNELTQQP